MWTYTDPSLIVGVKLQLTTPPNGKSGSTGSVVRFWRGVGRYAFVDEAAPLQGQALFNDQVVSYDIGKAPAGLNYEWLNGAQVTATEILSASPSGGGPGGGGVTTIVIYDVNTPTSVPVATVTKLIPDLLDANTDTAVITPDGSGGVTLVPAGIYTVTWNCTIPEPTAVNNAEIQIMVNGSSFWTAAGGYLVSEGAYSLSGSYQFLAAANTALWVSCYQDGPNPENVYPYWSVQGPWPT